jgi:hypothetical protein
LDGVDFERPRGRFSDLNAQAVAANRRVSVAKMLCRFRAADEKLRALYSTHAPATMVVEIKQGSKPWRLVDLVPAVEAHIRNHQRQLERAMKRPTNRAIKRAVSSRKSKSPNPQRKAANRRKELR